jgi:L-threonylcarbamoyladenylate synthase
MIQISNYSDALAILDDGGVGVIPTDTVYGLIARAFDPRAVRRLYALKHREHKPGTVIAANLDQLIQLGVSELYLRQVEKWWPNPLSVITPAGPHLAYLHVGLDSLPVRIPKDTRIQAFLEQSGPLLTSSANQPGEPPAATVEEAKGYFGTDVDFYMDGGDLSDKVPSTIIRVSEGKIEVLRQGSVELN